MLELATALGLGVGRLLDLVSDESEVVSGGGVPDTQGDTPPGMVRRVTAGALFLSNFSDVIVRRCVFQPRSALERVFTQTPRNGPMRALLGAILDHYLAGGDKLSRASVVDQMAANLRYLQRWTEPTASLEEKRAFLAVVGKLLVVDGGDPPHALAQPAARSVVPAYEAFLSQAAAPGETESERGLRVSLKREALGLLPFFLGPGVDGETRRRVLDSVRRLVAEHLLIQSRDLPQGSPQYNNYVRLLEGLLRALVASQSLGLLEELFPVLQFQGNTLRSRRIEEALGDFAGETARKEPKPLLELTLTLLHDGDKQPRLKKAVMDMVAVPALHAADETFLSEWFADKFEDFKRALSKEYSYRTRTDAETEQTELTTRTATLSLLELMYLRLSAEQLREECGVDKQKNVEMIRLCDDVIRSKERLKVMGVAPEQNPESARAWRGLQQAAYGCLAALLIKTQVSGEARSLSRFVAEKRDGFSYLVAY